MVWSLLEGVYFGVEVVGEGGGGGGGMGEGGIVERIDKDNWNRHMERETEREKRHTGCCGQDDKAGPMVLYQLSHCVKWRSDGEFLVRRDDGHEDNVGVAFIMRVEVRALSVSVSIAGGGR